MRKIFIGYDPRQRVSYNVLQQSIIEKASQPVAITPLVIESLPLKRQGLTPFTFSRFLVPHLCNYEGTALFLDADMLLNDDIINLFNARVPGKAVCVVKNPLSFEWASVMLFDCAHPSNRILSPEYIETAEKLHSLSWLKEGEIGELPPEWNHLVGYDAPRHDARLVHFTQGIPAFPEVAGCEYSLEWKNVANLVMTTRPWSVLMGGSVHAKPVLEKLHAK